MSVKRIIIVRHGETDYNVAHRWQGHLDVPLNLNGVQQARRLANYLDGLDFPVDAIYASDLSRAFDTARPLAQRFGLQIIAEPRLREINVGIFQGMSRHEMAQIAPAALEQWDSDDSYVVSNGESRLMLQQRAYAAWRDIVSRRDIETVVMVTHGGTIRMLLARLLPPERLLDRRFPNTSLTILDRMAGGKISANEIGITPHLERS